MKRLIALRKRAPGVRPRLAEVPASGQPAHRSPSCASTTASGSWSSPTCRASSSTPSSTCRRTAGLVPVEMFGRVEFPRVGDRPLLHHARPARVHLVHARERPVGRGARSAPTEERRADCSARAADLDGLLGGRARAQLLEALPAYMRARAGSDRRHGGSERSRCATPSGRIAGDGRARGAHRDLRRGVHRGRGRVVRAAARARPRRGRSSASSARRRRRSSRT